jgi:hypothetical protein
MNATVYAVASSPNREVAALTLRDYVIDFATWLSEQEEVDVATPDEAVDLWLKDDKP